MSTHEIYESPLVSRGASPEMLSLFSARHKFGLWRRLWLALARHERELGVTRITPEALAQMEANLDNIDFDYAAAREKELRHDVMAHIDAFEKAAPAAKGIIHLGATSMYVVDNADLIIMREGLRILARRLANVIDALGTFAARWRDLPTLGYTHYQPAQLTTVGKRAAMWAQDFALDLEELEHRIASLRFRGAKGTTGTQASFLSLFGGDHAKCDELDRRLTEQFGFPGTYGVIGQTYPRKVDAAIVNSLGGVAISVHKICNDIRLLANLKQIEEPFEAAQIGSSAMPYKRNPMRCERATGLARFVISIGASMSQTAAEQWLERTLDDSSNKRLVIPEAFLAVDAALLIVLNVARGLVVYPRTIESAIRAELPFMATEEILMAAVQAGGDRQIVHRKLRDSSQEAGAKVKQEGRPNDLLERLSADPDFAGIDFSALLDPARFTGLAPRQVDRFLIEVVGPIRERYRDCLGEQAQLKV